MLQRSKSDELLGPSRGEHSPTNGLLPFAG